MKKRLLILFSCALLLPSACGFSEPGKKAERPAIIQKYVAQSPKRNTLMKAYSKLHYGREMTDIKPRAVVVHWTANDSQEGTYQFFYAEENPRLSYGTLNVGAQFLVGRDGAIWQLMPETAEWISEESGLPADDLNRPDENIPLGAWYLNFLLKKYHNNEVLALAAYNAGRGNVDEWVEKYNWGEGFSKVDEIPFPETREFVKTVVSARDRLEAERKEKEKEKNGS